MTRRYESFYEVKSDEDLTSIFRSEVLKMSNKRWFIIQYTGTNPANTDCQKPELP
jgi:hypothetical protein